MSRPGVVGLVLAAGASKRMGPDRNKLLESIRGRALVTVPIQALRDAGVERIVVVLGHEADRVRAVLPEGVESIVHEGHDEGMGSSLAAGARHVRASDPEAAILVCVGDLPGLEPEPIRILLDAMAGAPADAIGVPVHAGRRGHPVCFGPARTGALASCSGDEGAKGVLRAAGASLIEVPVASSAILEDADTPADFDD